MLSKLTFLKIILLSLLFTGALFWFQTYYTLNFSDTLAEENYIEKSIFDDKYNQETDHVHETEVIIIESDPEDSLTQTSEIVDNLPAASDIDKQETAKQIFFTYIPTTLRSDVRNYRDTTRWFIWADDFEDKIQDLSVEFHAEMIDVRGRMKNKTIKIFDPQQLDMPEFLALFTHEFAHYLDLYYFSKSPFWDRSEDFYSISWESTKTMKRWQNQSDFVSGYAMTNKYEDFAETLTYYMFHNADFQKKAQESWALYFKYAFLRDYLFKGDSFVGTDFSDEKIQNYYWDITKIDIDDENFLQYLKKDI